MKPEPETPEQLALRQELVKEYGVHTFKCACDLAALTNCMVALAAGEMTGPERNECFRRAAHHLSSILALVFDVEQALQVTACAKRLDRAVDLWAFDDLEKEDGLPPYPNLG